MVPHKDINGPESFHVLFKMDLSGWTILNGNGGWHENVKTIVRNNVDDKLRLWLDLDDDTKVCILVDTAWSVQIIDDHIVILNLVQDLQ
ncbi:MAG: hypothetical protein UT32_C0042G0002 [Parcubacteria group bacterium GW2011_GWC2_39_14]|nr:MAG: hypothetical protein UT32_C0042G0002 [Parcubacteria group bacterium GW2011_GWC2_39_14]